MIVPIASDPRLRPQAKLRLALDEPHSCFDQAAASEQALAEVRRAVTVANLVAFPRKIKRISCAAAGEHSQGMLLEAIKSRHGADAVELARERVQVLQELHPP